jgi:hypothetical protein
MDGGPMEIRITFLGAGNDTMGSSAWQAAGDDFSIRFTPQGSANSASPAGQARGLSVPAGGWIDVAGDGYADKSQVRIHLIPRTAVRSRAWSPDPMTAVADAEVADGGTFTVRVEVPREAIIGDYALQVNGMSVGNKVRSVNMSLAVTDPSSALAGSQPTWATQSKRAFFVGGSERFTVVGQSKLRALAEFMPVNAMRVRVRVQAVSVSLGDLEENLMLAAKRGRRILVFLKSLGVTGSYTIIVQNQDVTAGSRPAAPGNADGGKPLTKVSVTYAVPRSVSASS